MVYENFKAKLIQEFETKRDMLVVRENRNRPESIFGIKNVNDQLYTSILNGFEIIALRNVENLVASLYEAKGIDYGMDATACKCSDMEFPVNGTKRVIEFKTQPNSMNTDAICRLADMAHRYDSPMLLVFLLKDSAASRSAVAQFAIHFKKVTNVSLECILFEEFLELAFGREERLAFQKSMANFKEEMHKVVGYQVTEIFNLHNLEKHKKELKDELLNFDYGKIRRQRSNGKNCLDLEEKDFDIIKRMYLDNRRYQALLGEADYAESYLTSEWLYRKYVFLDDLDNTFIVAGFLKSIEQLLWKVIFMVGRGRYMDGVEISEDNENEIDKTLGSLQHFICAWENMELYNKSFGKDKNPVRKYVKAQISEWRDKYRNGYFHKHNLKDKKRVDEIREETYFLYMLILGSIKMSGAQVETLK